MRKGRVLFRPKVEPSVRQTARGGVRGRGRGSRGGGNSKRKHDSHLDSNVETSDGPGSSPAAESKFKLSQGQNGVRQLTLNEYVVSFTNSKHDVKPKAEAAPAGNGFVSARSLQVKKETGGAIVIDSDESSDEVAVVSETKPVIRLDPAQERISKADFNRPLLIVAGAGSGKTATLCARVIELIKSGVMAEKILVITFTNKAAEELKQRIFRYMQASGLVKSDESGNAANGGRGPMRGMPYASTFHSWCYGIIMRFHSRLGWRRCPLVAATEAEHKKLMFVAREQLEDCVRLVQCEQMLDIKPVQTAGMDVKPDPEQSLYIHETEERWGEVLRRAKETTGFTLDQGPENEKDAKPAKRGKFTEKAKAASRHVSLMQALYHHLYAAIGEGQRLANLETNPVHFADAFPGRKDVTTEMLGFMYRAKSKGYASTQFPQLERSVLDAYNGVMRRFGLVDFDDLLDMTNQLLDDPGILQEIRGRFPYLLVDEFQDFNQQQTQLVMKLQDGVGRVTAVGDLKQSIFEFRGATCEQNYSIFLERFVDAQVEGKALGTMESLTTNYRSHKSIVDLSNILALETVDAKDAQLRRLLTPSAAVAGAPEVPVTVWESKSVHDEAAVISARIKEVLDKGDCTASDVAVISRCLNFGAYRPTGAIESALLRKGIPFVVRGGRSALKSRRMQLFMAAVRLIANPDDDIAADFCMSELVKNIGAVGMRKVHEQGAGRLGRTSLFDKMVLASTSPTLLPKNARAGLSAFLGDVDKWRRQMGQQTLAYIIKDIFVQYIFGVESESDEDKVGKPPAGAGADGVEDSVMDMCLAILDSLYETPELLAGEAAGTRDSPCTLAQLQAYSSHLCLLSTAAEDTGRLKKAATTQRAQYEGAVVISTVHQAKGLEWKHVFVNHFIENMFPMGFRGVSKADKVREQLDRRVAEQNARAEALHFREESRLGYVAITRAKVGLYISVLEEYPMAWMARIFDSQCRASRFLPDIMCSDSQTGASKRRRA
ncbi:hypothetical protein H4S02_003026 [Coemansia sp. RSA 2611]|nr:hypothetical protein H4S02_003026 [Coemansia sp. RSA 2611]